MVKPHNNVPTPAHLSRAKALWSLTEEPLFLRHVANFVYETKTSGGSVILRLTNPRDRTLEQLEAELDWARHLFSQGCSVAPAIFSNNTRLVEVLSDGASVFYASVFVKAKGRKLTFPEDYQSNTFALWGRVIGKLHSATLKEANAKRHRPLWHEDRMFVDACKGITKEDETPTRAFKDCIKEMSSLPMTSSNFALVHADLHEGNFLVDGSKMTFFDLDDSCYHWLAYDLAIPLTQVFRRFDMGGLSCDRNAIAEAFLSGYRLEIETPKDFLDHLKLFARYRVALVYHWCAYQKQAGVLDQNVIESMEPYMTWGREELKRK